MNNKIPRSTFQASADINPGVFVTLSDERIVTTSATGEHPVGVTALGTKDFSSTKLAAVGDPVPVFTAGQEADIILGATISAGINVRPNATGQAIAVTGTEHGYATLLTGGVSGDYVKCLVGLVQ